MASKSPRKSPVTKVPASPTDHPLDDEQLDRFRPARPNLVRNYVSRTLPGGLSDIDVLTKYWRRRTNGHPLNVGLVGDTQSGKTMLVEVLAHKLADELGLAKPLPVFTLSGSSAIRRKAR